MLNPYIPVLILMAVAVAVAAGMSVATSLIARIFRLRRPNPIKSQPYECGMTPIGGARVRFSVKFYLVAMLFILFDVEAIFLYPWAVVHRHLGWLGLVEMGLFIGILAAGYLYLWKRGAFEWD
ncbi:MAG: NADH-quinone oxidoreductase subunit A [Armatimonadetes bacterium]|nr:NADH-quinone oxidoreductase subunit A [Armatimonadota bacterium]